MKSWLLSYANLEELKKDGVELTRNPNYKMSFRTNFDWENGTLVDQKSLRDPFYSRVTLGFGLTGLGAGFFMQWYSAVRDAPLDIGGRPLNSWPAFIPVTFVLTILFAGLALFFAFFMKLKLPRISHPVFFSRGFNLSQDNYQIVLESVVQDGDGLPMGLHFSKSEELT